MPATVTKARIPTALGASIPAHSVHGISVSLPTWQDNIAYEEGDPRVIDKIRSAYPRFKIHHLIEKVSCLAIDVWWVRDVDELKGRDDSSKRSVNASLEHLARNAISTHP